MCDVRVCMYTLVIIITVNHLTSIWQRASIKYQTSNDLIANYTGLVDTQYYGIATKFNHLSLSASQIEVPAWHIIVVGSGAAWITAWPIKRIPRNQLQN